MTLDRDIYWKILRNQLTVKGTWNSTFLGFDSAESLSDDWHYVLKRLADGTVNPELLITHRLHSEDLYRGFTIMKDKSEDYCKVMMIERREYNTTAS
jgi:L-iditol 2-dehydrogenase